MELLKEYASQEYVKEVLHISSDGNMVMWISFIILQLHHLSIYHSIRSIMIFKKQLLVAFPDMIVSLEFKN